MARKRATKARRPTPAQQRAFLAALRAHSQSAPSAAGLATYAPGGVQSSAGAGLPIYGGPAAPPRPQQPFNVLVPLAKAVLPDVLQQMPSSIGNALPSLAAALPAVPAAMAVDKLISAMPLPVQLLAAPLALGPKTIVSIAGKVSDFVGNILGGGGYTPEELAKNQAILTGQAAAGQSAQVSTRIGAGNIASRITRVF